LALILVNPANNFKPVKKSKIMKSSIKILAVGLVLFFTTASFAAPGTVAQGGSSYGVISHLNEMGKTTRQEKKEAKKEKREAKKKAREEKKAEKKAESPSKTPTK